ncbi:MAG: MBL fold metallo-hydrolase [Gemmatimonadetes bacterium]|nr:MBL fold metallo-hydrolase [Gemmatimonadota bacterium]
MSDVQIRTFVAPGFEQNAYLVWRAGSTLAVAIDPGGRAPTMADALSTAGLALSAILLTHAHIDHVEGVPELVRRTNAPIRMHYADLPLYERAADQAAMFGMRPLKLPPIGDELAHGQELDLAGLRFDVRHVPGHSPGHVILHLREAGAAFVGDVVFRASIGRTDLPGGSFPQLIDGIRKHVFTLPDDTTLYCGHGPPTTVAHERATNPFLVPQYGGGLA